jgi:hypothetical protein
MLVPTLAAVAIPESNDDRRLSAEPKLARLRAQAAVVRSLTDHVDRFGRTEDADGLSEQLAEERVRLGALEAAASIEEVR